MASDYPAGCCPLYKSLFFFLCVWQTARHIKVSGEDTFTPPESSWVWVVLQNYAVLFGLFVALFWFQKQVRLGHKACVSYVEACCCCFLFFCFCCCCFCHVCPDCPGSTFFRNQSSAEAVTGNRCCVFSRVTQRQNQTLFRRETTDARS